LGLILVDLGETGSGPVGRKTPGSSAAAVQVAFHPLPPERRSRSDVKRAVLAELHGRSVDLNQGGSTRHKIVTAYRENAVQIACYLMARGPTSPATLRQMGTGDKTLSILRSNFYAWFERVARGIYALTAKGCDELREYPALVERYAPDAAGIAARPSHEQREDVK
jgi:hypothetical protein